MDKDLKSIILNSELFLRLKEYMDTHKAFRLANDPLTSPNVLSDLASSVHEEIRAGVAANPSSSKNTLLSLVGDKSQHVIDNLMKNCNKLKEGLIISPCKNTNLTLVETDDAEFILSLRNNDRLNRYVSQVSSDLNAQKKWIIDYKTREEIRAEFYFIVRDLNNHPFGTVRIYDFRNGSFCWGSWMIAPESPRKLAIESALSVYEFAFYTLKFDKSHFDVRNNNQKVIDFHKRMGASILYENELDTFFIYTKESYEKIKGKYAKFLKN